VTTEFIASLREEIREMVQRAIEENRYSIIVAIEQDEHQDKNGIEA